MLYLSNAFSINMLPKANATLAFIPITPKEAKRKIAEVGLDFGNVIGHADTDRVVRADLSLGDEYAGVRVSVTFQPHDQIIVAQYTGPRLTEGTTKLPEGATINYWWVL